MTLFSVMCNSYIRSITLLFTGCPQDTQHYCLNEDLLVGGQNECESGMNNSRDLLSMEWWG